MKRVVDKDVALVVSAGRTGTRFFGKKMQEVFTDCVSFHEPDSVQPKTWRHDLAFNVKHFGVYSTLAGKLSGRSGIRNISRRFLAGDLDERAAKKEILKSRSDFYSSFPERFIVECNYSFFALLDLVSDVFPGVRVAAITRDPFGWIRSYLRKDDHFGRRDHVERLGFRLSAPVVRDYPAADFWGQMSTTERLAWFYEFVYSRVLRAQQANVPLKVWRYEDLFLSDERQHNLEEFCGFLGDFGQRKYSAQISKDLLAKKVNASPDRELEVADGDIWNAIEKWCASSARAFGYL